MLSRDTFQRADQQFWGTASDGQTWAGDAVKAPVFAIVNHTGQVGNGSGIYDALLGPRAADTQIVFSGSVAHFAASNMGALLRWTDADNLYKVFIDGTNLTVHLSNIYSHNAWEIPFLFEDPIGAHNNYPQNYWLMDKLVDGFGEMKAASSANRNLRCS